MYYLHSASKLKKYRSTYPSLRHPPLDILFVKRVLLKVSIVGMKLNICKSTPHKVNLLLNRHVDICLVGKKFHSLSIYLFYSNMKARRADETTERRSIPGGPQITPNSTFVHCENSDCSFNCLEGADLLSLANLPELLIFKVSH